MPTDEDSFKNIYVLQLVVVICKYMLGVCIDKVYMFVLCQYSLCNGIDFVRLLLLCVHILIAQ